MKNGEDLDESGSISRQRTTLMIGGLISLPMTIGLWLALYHSVPPIQGVDTPLDRLLFALKCCCVAVLLSFVLGIPGTVAILGTFAGAEIYLVYVSRSPAVQSSQ